MRTHRMRALIVAGAACLAGGLLVVPAASAAPSLHVAFEGQTPANGSTVVHDTPVTATLRVSNTGTTDAAAVKLVMTSASSAGITPVTAGLPVCTDGSAPSGQGNTVSCLFTSIPAGQSRTLTVNASFPSDPHVNQVTLTGETFLGANQQPDATTTRSFIVPAVSGASIDVVFDAPASHSLVPAGTPVHARLHVTNTAPAGAGNLATNVHVTLHGDSDYGTPTFSDLRCNGTATTSPPLVCQFGELAPGQTRTMEVTVTTVSVNDVNGVVLEADAAMQTGGDSAGVEYTVQATPRPKADLNVQVQAPTQLAIGETGELKTTLNMVSGDAADGVKTVPTFRMFSFSTLNVDVLGVSATAGTCKIEPRKFTDPTTHQPVVVPNMVDISCDGGTLAPGGAITATVTVKAKSPGV